MAEHKDDGVPSLVEAKETLCLDNAVFFIDIDDTLIPTADTLHGAGILAVGRVLGERLDDANLGDNVAKRMDSYFQLMVKAYRVRNDDWSLVSGGKAAFNALIARIEAEQQGVLEEWGSIRKWSREAFAKMACDDFNVDVTAELIEELGGAYWMAVTQNMKPYDHAKAFLDTLQTLDRPVFLATSSDGRLIYNEDRGTFVYDPVVSERLKHERMETLRTRHDLAFRLIVVGDPEEKPHDDFFQKAIDAAEEDLGDKIDRGLCVAVGDSFGGDVQVPLERFGFGLGVVFSPSVDYSKDGERLVTVGALTDIERAIAEMAH